MYYVYILYCVDKSYYIGITNNIILREAQHNAGLNKKSFTYKRRPVKLVYYTEFSDVNDAIAFEKRIKGWSRAKKEALISERFEDLPQLSMNKQKREEFENKVKSG